MFRETDSEENAMKIKFISTQILSLPPIKSPCIYLLMVIWSSMSTCACFCYSQWYQQRRVVLPGVEEFWCWRRIYQSDLRHPASPPAPLIVVVDSCSCRRCLACNDNIKLSLTIQEFMSLELLPKESKFTLFSIFESVSFLLIHT